MRMPHGCARCVRAGASVGADHGAPHGVVAGQALIGRPVVVRLVGVAGRIGPPQRGGEGTGREDARQRRRLPLDGAEASARRGIAHRGRQQRGRVAVSRPVQQSRGRPELHDASRVHGGDTVGRALQQPQVVGDDHDRGTQLPHQRHERLDDLHLDQRVQRGRGLIGDDQLRLAREGRGDGRALQHAAGELVGVAPQQRRRLRHTQAPEQVHRPRIRSARRQPAMQLQRASHLRAHAPQRVEGAEGVLRHERHARPPQRCRLVDSGCADDLAVEPDLAGR